MVAPAVMVPLIATCLAGAGVVANEASHGAMAQAMGLGHHHPSDVGGYHCAAHDGPLGAQHQQHMHDQMGVAHADCPGGAGMHHMNGTGGMGMGA